jgi:hypothetical protein
MGCGPGKREEAGVGSVREKGKKDGWAAGKKGPKGLKAFQNSFFFSN